MVSLAPKSETAALAEMQKAVEDCFLISAQTKGVLDAISLLHTMGGEDTSRRSRSGRGVLIVAGAGTGKSSLIDFYRNEVAPQVREKLIQIVPCQPARSVHIIAELLENLDDDCPLAGSPRDREKRCFDLLKERGTELIFFDELHQFTSSGSRRDVNTRGGHWLKTFMDHCSCPVVGFATEEVFELLGRHDELSSRFPVRIPYDPFSWDVDERQKDFFAFLRALEKRVSPLRATGVLTNPRVAAEIHAHTQGRARLVKHAIIGAASSAIRRGLPGLPPEMVIVAAKETGLKALRDGVFRLSGPALRRERKAA